MTQIIKVMTEKDGLVRHTKLATVSADGKRIEMNRSIENLTPLKLEAGVKDREYMVPGPGDSITPSGKILAYMPRGSVKNVDP